MSTTQYLIHATGLIALYLNIRGLVRPCDRTLRQTTGVAAFLWALNNFLLGAYAAAALSLVSAGRQVSATAVQSSTQRKRMLACGGFMLLSLAVGVFTWHGPTTMFTLGAVLLTTYAMFYMHGSRLRMSMLLVSMLWMVNAFAFDSLEQMAANLATAVAAVIGARRSKASLQRDVGDGPFVDRQDERVIPTLVHSAQPCAEKLVSCRIEGAHCVVGSFRRIPDRGADGAEGVGKVRPHLHRLPCGVLRHCAAR